MNPEIFREYDIRGIADRELTDDVVQKIAKAFATYLKKAPVVVGGDIRLSTERIKKTLISALRGSGISVIDIGTVPTPVFYFYLHTENVAGGIQITASHNPPEYNGFKLCKGKDAIYGEEIQKIRLTAERSDFIEGSGNILQTDAIPAYIAKLKEIVRLGPRRLKVAVDCGNGCAGLVVPQILSQLGCDVIELFSEPDGRFPNHFPDPTIPENLEELVSKVRETEADVGIGFDGDVDRIGVVDDRGNILWGDRLMVLFFREILPKHPKAPCIIEVKCSKVLFQEAERLGGEPFFYKTGHSLIKAKMKEVGALFAGEMSGHMFFADEYYGFDDAIYAALRLLRILSATEKSLSELLSNIPVYPITPELRLDCPDDKKDEVVKEISEHFKKRYECIDVDGVRVLFPDGWALIRKSNTSPKIIVRFEAETEERLSEIKSLIFDKLSEHPEVKIDG
jgi:phosphoglucosamine mutase